MRGLDQERYGGTIRYASYPPGSSGGLTLGSFAEPSLPRY